uniref:Uncharacterized protein n=1 Tax=Anguilla anguilla TaxID=7936 RepID=A0A0E9PDY2_ANGAN
MSHVYITFCLQYIFTFYFIWFVLYRRMMKSK